MLVTGTRPKMIRQQMIDKATRELEATKKAEDNKEEKEVSVGGKEINLPFPCSPTFHALFCCHRSYLHAGSPFAGVPSSGNLIRE